MSSFTTNPKLPTPAPTPATATATSSTSNPLKTDLPNLKSALKNLISTLAAHALLPLSEITNNPSTDIMSASALKCARVLLKGVEAFVFVDVVEWGAKFKQKEEQTGIDRITQIVNYKQFYELYTSVKANHGKMSELFGLKLFEYTSEWGSIRKTIRALCPDGVSEDVFKYFLDCFETSLNLPESESSSAKMPAYIDKLELTELVWCDNYYAVLKERQEKRKVNAALRLESLVEDDLCKVQGVVIEELNEEGEEEDASEKEVDKNLDIDVPSMVNISDDNEPSLKRNLR